MEDPKQAFVEYASLRTDEAGADGTKSYPVGIVKDVEVLIRKLKLLNDFYVIDMKKDLETPVLVGRGFLAIANAVIDYRRAKIAVGEGITRKGFLDCHLSGEWQIARDAELNPFKDTLVFRRMYCIENPEQAFVEYVSSRTDEAGGEMELTSVSFKTLGGFLPIPSSLKAEGMVGCWLGMADQLTVWREQPYQLSLG
nr:hypothetical protein [Tanacetum cinerariifolium]